MRRIAVIMAGGAGERFWPVSRLSRPKQLLNLSRPDMSLLEEAVHRVTPLFGEEGVFVATGQTVQEPITASGVVPLENVWVEPLKRNTLGCLCWVAANLLAASEEEVGLAVLTADHRIRPAETFRSQVCLALDIAEERGALVTIGIPPTRPDTGFGYVEFDESTEGPDGVFQARSFREKPDAATAALFLEEGRFLWNSGMVFMTLRSFLKELENVQSEAHRLTLQMAEALKRGNTEAAERAFAELPNISIDFAVLEKAKNVAVVASKFEWDDVGSWDALERNFDLDESGNVVYGDAIVADSEGCLIYNDSESKLTTVLGAKDLLVVVTNDAVMVCPKSEAQRVREIVQRVKESKPELT